MLFEFGKSCRNTITNENNDRKYITIGQDPLTERYKFYLVSLGRVAFII